MKQVIGFCLLLSVATTLFPVNFFHNHAAHEHAHCDVTNASLESDPCHISLYHAESIEYRCEHNSHATETEEECELCKYITTERTFHIHPSIGEVLPLLFSTGYPLTVAPAGVWNSSLSIKGRAPPIV